MLTVFLWVLLVASVGALVILALPIRFGVNVEYRENGRESHSLGFWIVYMHPAVFSLRHSSLGGGSRTVILGFKSAGGEDGGAVDLDGANTDGGGINTGKGGIDTDEEAINTGKGVIDTGTDGIDTNDVDADGIGTDGIDVDNVGTDGVDTDNIGTDGINTDKDGINTDTDKDGINTNKKSPPRSLMSRIQATINSIKNRKVYKIISNKPLRKKLFRWLRRSAVCLVRTVPLEKFSLRATVGLRDPAALGSLYGYFSAARSALELRNYPSVDVALYPVFTERCLEVTAEVAGRTSLSVVLWNLGVIGLTFPYWRVYRILSQKAAKSPNILTSVRA